MNQLHVPWCIRKAITVIDEEQLAELQVASITDALETVRGGVIALPYLATVYGIDATLFKDEEWADQLLIKGKT